MSRQVLTLPDLPGALLTQSEADGLYLTEAAGDLRYALLSALTALTTRVATLESQVATLQAQTSGHTHTTGTHGTMGGTAVLP